MKISDTSLFRLKNFAKEDAAGGVHCLCDEDRESIGKLLQFYVDANEVKGDVSILASTRADAAHKKLMELVGEYSWFTAITGDATLNSIVGSALIGARSCTALWRCDNQELFDKLLLAMLSVKQRDIARTLIVQSRKQSDKAE